jgi:hypothetical protein
VRKEESAASVGEIMEQRRKRMVSMLPTEDSAGDDEHPWHAFVKRVVTVSPAAELRKAALTGRGTPVKDQAETLAKWMEAQRDYYLKENAEPNDMLAAQKGAERVAAGQPFEADVVFMGIFWHAHRLQLFPNLFKNNRRDERAARFFTFWKPIFDFTPKTAILEDEVNRLCREKLGDFCKPIPMEDRVFHVTKPYFEGVAKRIDDYKGKFPQSPYVPFLDRVAAVYRNLAGEVPPVEEFPVLPVIRSTIPAPVAGNATLSVTQKGVTLMDNVLRAPDKPVVPEKPELLWKPTFAADDAALHEAAGKLVEDVRSTTMSQYNQSLITVLAEADVPVAYLEPLLRATIVGDHSKEWPTLILAGRRREDGSNRRAGYTMTVLAKDKTVPFALKPPAGKPMKCDAFAVLGKDALASKGFLSVVFHDGKQVHAGKLGADGTLSNLQSAPPHGEGDRLDGWAAAQQNSFVVAVPAGATYSQWLESLNGAALGLDAEGEIKVPRTVPVFVASCR